MAGKATGERIPGKKYRAISKQPPSEIRSIASRAKSASLGVLLMP